MCGEKFHGRMVAVCQRPVKARRRRCIFLNPSVGWPPARFFENGQAQVALLCPAGVRMRARPTVHLPALVLLSALLSSLVGGGAAAQTAPMAPDIPARFAAPTDDNDYVKRDLMIAMRDGVKRHTVIVVPKGASGAPIMLTRTPYDAGRRAQRKQRAAGRPGLRLRAKIRPRPAQLHQEGVRAPRLRRLLAGPGARPHPGQARRRCRPCT
jgi:hypothetical protein